MLFERMELGGPNAMMPSCSNRFAAAPVAAGQAIEVPLITAHKLTPATAAGAQLTMPTPGAIKSTSRPMFEKEATKLFLSLPNGDLIESLASAPVGKVPFLPIAPTATDNE
jgi:hypothetical protein